MSAKVSAVTAIEGGAQYATDRAFSIYCTYEEAAAIPAPILTAVQENGNIKVSWTYPV